MTRWQDQVGVQRGEAILMRVIDCLGTRFVPRIAIVDCQVQASIIRKVVAGLPGLIPINVLLNCPRELREQRLVSRGWDGVDFHRIDVWPNLLLSDALEAGDLILLKNR